MAQSDSLERFIMKGFHSFHSDLFLLFLLGFFMSTLNFTHSRKPFHSAPATNRKSLVPLAPFPEFSAALRSQKRFGWDDSVYHH